MNFNLKEKREAAGLSQTELAKISGVGRVTINRIETGELKETTAGTLVKLSNALKCAIDDLIK